MEAISLAGTVLAILTKEGCVLVAEKVRAASLFPLPTSIHTIALWCGLLTIRLPPNRRK